MGASVDGWIFYNNARYRPILDRKYLNIFSRKISIEILKYNCLNLNGTEWDIDMWP